MNAKTNVRYENGTSFLHISNAQRDDIGHFRCIADNRVANPVSRDALLIVKCKFPYLFLLYHSIHLRKDEGFLTVCKPIGIM